MLGLVWLPLGASTGATGPWCMHCPELLVFGNCAELSGVAHPGMVATALAMVLTLLMAMVDTADGYGGYGKQRTWFRYAFTAWVKAGMLQGGMRVHFFIGSQPTLTSVPL